MADFEGLIRQALAKQDSANPEIRAKIYQSSRNALARMIKNASNVAPGVIDAQEKALESSIRRIEGEFRKPAVQPPPQATRQGAPHPQDSPGVKTPQVVRKPVDRVAPVRSESTLSTVGDRQAPPIARSRIEPDFGDPAAQVGEPVYPDHGQHPSPGTNNASEEYETSNRLKRKRRWPLQLAGILAVVLLLIVLGWLVYSMAVTYLTEWNSPNGITAEVNQTATNADSEYITILEPQEISSLVTAGRGKAEILSEQNRSVIRIVSVRDNAARGDAAQPILLQLKPGVIKEIAGKKVMVEILAKSGSSTPAAFAVACEFGTLGSCGRKRFRVGLQPEAIVFAISIKAGADTTKNAYLTVNTDITPNANLTGQGEAVDIVYARLRIADGE